MRPLSTPRRALPRSPLRRGVAALAWAGWAVSAVSAAQAAVTPTGTVSTRLAGSFAGGLGDFLLPGDEMWVGLNTAGTLAVNGGSLLRVGALELAQNGGGVVPVTGTSTLTLAGAGSKIELNGAPSGGRLGIAGWGTALMTVSGGATLDGRLNSAICATVYCGNSIAGTAGSDGTLTVTGAGSSVSLLKNFSLAGAQVNNPVLDGYTYGTPGGSARATLNVLAGATLATEGSAQLSTGSSGRGALGSETTQATVRVDGANSVWHITASSVDTAAAGLQTATKAGATATITVSNGGTLWMDGKAGVYNAIGLSTSGGNTTMSVSGAGSTLQFSGDAGVLQVGRNGAASSSALSFSDGAAGDGIFYVSVGRDSATGTLSVDGAATQLRLNGTASAAANGTLVNAAMDIGRGGGTGTVDVRNGGLISLVSQAAGGGNVQLNLGRDAASSGTLNIAGAGSTVKLSSPSFVAGGGPAEGYNPLVRVGRDTGGTGTLNITNGGLLWLDGQAVSTVADSRSTSVYIGGNNDTTNGGTGTALVSGSGSAIVMTGSDDYIGVGHGPQSQGTLTVADLASVNTTIIIVGRSGGTGLLNVDHARIGLSGQQTGNNLAGANMSVGRSGGTGTANFSNASVLTITNPGSAGASFNVGGTSTGPFGTGAVTLSGASQINVVAGPRLATVTVGRDGTGTMLVTGASSVNVGDGSVTIARLAGSTGSLTLEGNSTITAGFVGVGRVRSGSSDVDGGTAALFIDNSTVTATNLVIGSGGLLGGSGGTIVGTVTNHGTISPGHSPGTLTIDGDFTADAGSVVLLDVDDDGHDGFVTDQLVFGSTSTQSLDGMSVVFHFLGNTNPNRFLASGRFGIDTFLRQLQPGGGSSALDPIAYAGVSFSASSEGYAISNFSYSAYGGASFTAAAVPEPGVGLLWLAGLAAVALLVHRRQR